MVLASLIAGSAWLGVPSTAHARDGSVRGVGIAQGVQPPAPTAPSPAPTPEEAPPQPEIQRPTVVEPVIAPEAEGPEEVPVAPAPAPVVAEPTQPPPQAVVTTTGSAEPSPEPLPVGEEEVRSPVAPKTGLELPGRTGRGLMMGSFAAGGLGWAMSLGTIGMAARGCSDLDRCLSGLVVLTGVRWMANGTALGLAIPAGVFRGRYDAIDSEINGVEPRNIDAFVKGGAAAIGVGTAGWVIFRIGAFTFLPNTCTEGVGCAVAYLAGLQTSFALASAGAGMLSYGLAHREQKRKIGRAVQVRVMPQLSPQYSGLSLAGRF